MRSVAVLLIACLVGSCGSGGGDSSPATRQFIFGGEDDRDGMVSNDGIVNRTLAPFLGDIDGSMNGQVFRQFFSFYIDLLPPGATVVSAELWLFQQDTSGTPFTDLGSIVVDHMFYDLLGAADFAAAPLAANIGTLSTDPAVGYRILDVTSAVQADFAAGRPRSQYRLRFDPIESDGDSSTDIVSFNDTENSWNERGGLPLLIVQYLP